MSFSSTLRKGLVMGENSTAEHTVEDVGDARVALFFALVRDITSDRILELLRECTRSAPLSRESEVVADIFVMAFQTRDCRGGKGERTVFYHMLRHLYRKFPITTLTLIPLIAEYGYFKDLCYVMELAESPQERELRAGITNFIATQLVADDVLVGTAAQLGADSCDVTSLAELRRKVSLCAKYAPREGTHFSKSGLVKEIACKIFPDDHKTAKAQYRKLLSRITRFLDVTEVKMCGKHYRDIDYSRVPSLCMKRCCKAFLNEKLRSGSTLSELETGNRYPLDDDRVASRLHLRDTIMQQKVQGKQLFPHEIVEGFVNDGSMGALQQMMLDVQWTSIRQNLLDQLTAAAAAAAAAATTAAATTTTSAMNVGRLVPLSDVSGSMSGLPMMVSIALGILISEVNHAAFRDRVVTFETSPEWVNLSECNTIAEKVQKLQAAPWGGSTNIERVFEMLAEVVLKHKLPIDEVPDLIIFSDMQFDEACHGSAATQTQLERIRERFHNLGIEISGEPYPAPRIIFWNLRSGTVGFPAQAESENVQMLSGFSPALLKFVLEGDGTEDDSAEDGASEGKGNGASVSISPQQQQRQQPSKKKINPYSTVRRVLDDTRYHPIRRLLHDSNEGLLRGYTFTEPQPSSSAIVGAGSVSDAFPDAVCGNSDVSLLPVPPHDQDDGILVESFSRTEL